MKLARSAASGSLFPPSCLGGSPPVVWPLPFPRQSIQDHIQGKGKIQVWEDPAFLSLSTSLTPGQPGELQVLQWAEFAQGLCKSPLAHHSCSGPPL